MERATCDSLESIFSKNKLYTTLHPAAAFCIDQQFATSGVESVRDSIPGRDAATGGAGVRQPPPVFVKLKIVGKSE